MLTLDVLGTAQKITFQDFSAIVAGYTARDQEAVNHHIEELAKIGVPAPPRTPMFYPVDSKTVTTVQGVAVSSSKTSGEVEPVYIRHHGRYYLGVGSDHTDRELETQDIHASKRACPKPIGRSVLPVKSIDDLKLTSLVASCKADGELYQQASLDVLLDPADVLGQLEKELDLGEDDYVVFGGTLPLIGGEFRYATSWSLSIRTASPTEPTESQSLTHDYITKIER